jgi:hypothetical protein
VAERRILADRQQRRLHVAADADDAVDGVDAAVQPAQQAPPQAPLHRLLRDPESEQLREGNDAELPGGELPDEVICRA